MFVPRPPGERHLRRRPFGAGLGNERRPYLIVAKVSLLLLLLLLLSLVVVVVIVIVIVPEVVVIVVVVVVVVVVWLVVLLAALSLFVAYLFDRLHMRGSRGGQLAEKPTSGVQY